MKKYICAVCGYAYDPQKGHPEHQAPAGTAFEDLPHDWLCPTCKADKTLFEHEDKYRRDR